jgi:hypothetical protein
MSRQSPYALSAVTKENGIHDTWASFNISKAILGFVVNFLSLGMPAPLQRSASSVHSFGRYSPLTIAANPLGDTYCQEHSDLAVFNFACCAAILSCNPCRHFTFLYKACIINYQYSIVTPKFIFNIFPETTHELHQHPIALDIKIAVLHMVIFRLALGPSASFFLSMGLIKAL